MPLFPPAPSQAVWVPLPLACACLPQAYFPWGDSHDGVVRLRGAQPRDPCLAMGPQQGTRARARAVALAAADTTICPQAATASLLPVSPS